ncbi:hypothetical protein, partial [Sansalvadorimonas verongulae]|uniref:hypothetical protein n=1 Tax=Sansalvadorimonas verongulae TaxID=2172824 RepID=UPI001E2CA438
LTDSIFLKIRYPPKMEEIPEIVRNDFDGFSIKKPKFNTSKLQRCIQFWLLCSLEELSVSRREKWWSLAGSNR